MLGARFVITLLIEMLVAVELARKLGLAAGEVDNVMSDDESCEMPVGSATIAAKLSPGGRGVAPHLPSAFRLFRLDAVRGAGSLERRAGLANPPPPPEEGRGVGYAVLRSCSAPAVSEPESGLVGGSIDVRSSPRSASRRSVSAADAARPKYQP